MSEKEIDAFIQELRSYRLELYPLVVENNSLDSTDKELKDLVAEFESNSLELRESIINALNKE